VPNPNPETEARAIAALAAAGQQPLVVEGVPVLILPEGYRLHQMDHLAAAPARKKGNTVLNDLASLIDVVKEQKTPSTHLYGTLNPPSFVAVFNDTHDAAGWGDHKASYTPPVSPEWLNWIKFNGTKQDQAALAQFIEDNVDDVVEPEGALLLEICRTLQAKKDVNFVSHTRASDGSVAFTYDEDVKGSSPVRGGMAIPEQFIIGIPVFENGDRWRVTVRLRYRLAGGQLTMWYELVRPHKVIEVAVKDIREKLAAGTELHVLNGTPPAVRG